MARIGTRQHAPPPAWCVASWTACVCEAFGKKVSRHSDFHASTSTISAPKSRPTLAVPSNNDMPPNTSPRAKAKSAPPSRFSTLDKKASKAFQAFCKSSAAEENLDFLNLVKKFKKANSAGRVKYFHKISVQHLDPTSSVAPVNLDCSLLKAIRNQAEPALASGLKLPRDLFDEAELFITEIVDLDLLPKFQTRSRSNSTWA